MKRAGTVNLRDIPSKRAAVNLRGIPSNWRTPGALRHAHNGSRLFNLPDNVARSLVKQLSNVGANRYRMRMYVGARQGSHHSPTPMLLTPYGAVSPPRNVSSKALKAFDSAVNTYKKVRKGEAPRTLPQRRVNLDAIANGNWGTSQGGVKSAAKYLQKLLSNTNSNVEITQIGNTTRQGLGEFVNVYLARKRPLPVPRGISKTVDGILKRGQLLVPRKVSKARSLPGSKVKRVTRSRSRSR